MPDKLNGLTEEIEANASQEAPLKLKRSNNIGHDADYCGYSTRTHNRG